MSFRLRTSRMDQVLEWAKSAGTWRTDVREVAATPDRDGDIRRRVADVLIPPQGPTYRAENSRTTLQDVGVPEFADFVELAANSFADLVEEGDRARALLAQVQDQLDPQSREEVKRLLASPTVRSEWDKKVDSWF